MSEQEAQEYLEEQQQGEQSDQNGEMGDDQGDDPDDTLIKDGINNNNVEDGEKQPGEVPDGAGGPEQSLGEDVSLSGEIKQVESDQALANEDEVWDVQESDIQEEKPSRPSSNNSTGRAPSSQDRPATDVSPNALNLSWSFGINRHVPAINMTEPQRRAVLYVCGITAVLYDLDKHTQRLLQGHSNNISCTCVSYDKRWIATADRGPGSMVIIWDSYTGTPVQTIFDAHSNVGVAAMDMTPDAKYIVSLSAATQPQNIAIWDWTVNGESPVVRADLPSSKDLHTYVTFDPEDVSQVVSNSVSQVVFYEWTGESIKYIAPELTDQDFNRAVGSYSQSMFCSGSTRALTATSLGNVVVWDNIRPKHGSPVTKRTPKKKAFKLVRLQEKGITVLTATDRYIVSGDILGHVRFYDQQLTLLNWYSDFDVGPLNSVSFEYKPSFTPEAKVDSRYPSDATIKAKSFVTRDYIISTTAAQIAHVISDGSHVTMILNEHASAIHGLVAHPNEPWIAVGSYSGLLQVWNYEEKSLIVSRKFSRGNMIRCITFDPKGCYLGVGFTNGSVQILDAITLEDECPEPFRYSRDAVTHCAFSHDSLWFATADADFCVTVYEASSVDPEQPWTYLGKYRAHYKPIRSILFGVALDSDLPRLLSLGEDRSLVEYDLKRSAVDDLKVLATERIEQSAVPQCMTWYPPVTKEQFYLTANDQFKFKLYNTTTTMCRHTFLSPTYGTPLQKIEVLPTADVVRDKRYMAYITTDKVGLNMLPLDGNPHNSMASIAHPSGVTNLVCSNDGRYIFTTGGTDATTLMWQVNVIALEAGSKLGGDGLIPFYGLLEGGRDGEHFRELENYFYYAQIRRVLYQRDSLIRVNMDITLGIHWGWECADNPINNPKVFEYPVLGGFHGRNHSYHQDNQGVDTTEMRAISDTIPISEVPYVMRAMGHYSSEQEVEDMINEVKFSRYVDTGEYVNKIALGDLIRLYVNHRPAFGLNTAQLSHAFEVLGLSDGDEAPSIDRGELLDLLQTKGEHMTDSDLTEYITTLLGLNPEGGSSELGSYEIEGSTNLIEEFLPDRINAEHFLDDILGFGLMSEDSREIEAQ